MTTPVEVPRSGLVDANGTITFEHVGEGNYDEIESKAVRLLAESRKLAAAKVQ